jgi:hypothetical protein
LNDQVSLGNLLRNGDAHVGERGTEQEHGIDQPITTGFLTGQRIVVDDILDYNLV